MARRRACGASSGQTTSVPGSVRVKDKQAKGHVKCTTDSLAVLATSLQRRRVASNVQRATCNVQPAPTCNGSCQVFLFVFHRPSRAAAIYLPSPRPGIARRPDAISVRSAAAPTPPPAPPPPSPALLCCPLWCPARRSLCFFFYIITSTWAWAACPGHKFKFNAAGRLSRRGVGGVSVEGTA